MFRLGERWGGVCGCREVLAVGAPLMRSASSGRAR